MAARAGGGPRAGDGAAALGVVARGGGGGAGAGGAAGEEVGGAVAGRGLGGANPGPGNQLALATPPAAQAQPMSLDATAENAQRAILTLARQSAKSPMVLTLLADNNQDFGNLAATLISYSNQNSYQIQIGNIAANNAPQQQQTATARKCL